MSLYIACRRQEFISSSKIAKWKRCNEWKYIDTPISGWFVAVYLDYSWVFHYYLNIFTTLHFVCTWLYYVQGPKIQLTHLNGKLLIQFQLICSMIQLIRNFYLLKHLKYVCACAHQHDFSLNNTNVWYWFIIFAQIHMIMDRNHWLLCLKKR